MYQGYSTGNKTLNVDLSPGEPSAFIKPLWFSITFLAMDRPTPVALFIGFAKQVLKNLLQLTPVSSYYRQPTDVYLSSLCHYVKWSFSFFDTLLYTKASENKSVDKIRISFETFLIRAGARTLVHDQKTY